MKEQRVLGIAYSQISPSSRLWLARCGVSADVQPYTTSLWENVNFVLQLKFTVLQSTSHPICNGVFEGQIK